MKSAWPSGQAGNDVSLLKGITTDFSHHHGVTRLCILVQDKTMPLL